METGDALAELRETRKTIEKLGAALDSRANTANGNTITVAVDAGGIGVRICVGVCIFLLACNLAIGFAYLDLKREVDGLNDYLSAIYMQAPHLKPEEKP